MHDFRKTRIIIWDIAEYKANILMHLQKYWSHRSNSTYQSLGVGNYPLMIAKTIIPNLLKDVEKMLVHRDSY